MPDLVHQLGLYLHLARASQRRQRPHAWARLLVLAGVAASRLHLPTVAAFCRDLVLGENPHHLLRRWRTFEEALADEEFLRFLARLEARYPVPKAERMLASLGLQMAREREAYYNDLEYAAALLGTSPGALERKGGKS